MHTENRGLDQREILMRSVGLFRLVKKMNWLCMKWTNLELTEFDLIGL